MRIGALLLALALFAPPLAQAHGGGPTLPGDTLATATRLGLPARAFATGAAAVDVHYYRFVVRDAAEVRLRLVAPVGQEPDRFPLVMVFGPSFRENATAVPDIETPPDPRGLAFLASERAHADEPALAARWTALLDRTLAIEPGEHYVIVRSEGAGPLGLLIEAEGVRWLDRFLLPGQRDDARAWAGAAAWPALAAGAMGVAFVSGLAWRRRGRHWSLHALAAYGSASLLAASGLALATDAARTGVGWSYVAAALGCAALALFSTRAPSAQPTIAQRAMLAATALVAFVAYAGFMWGPVLALAGAVLPEPAVDGKE